MAFFVVIWYLDKDWIIFIFEIEFLFLLFISSIKMIFFFIIISPENVNYTKIKWFCGTKIMAVMFSNQSN